jgi:succinate-acetate transporter protein
MMSGMTEATESVQKRTTANKSAGPITAGLGGLILGAGLFSIGTANAAPVATIIGVAAFLIGLVALLDGVYKLVGNIDSATQALLERRP